MNRTRRRLLIGALISVALFATALTIWSVRSASRLETVLQDIDEAGLPTRIEDLPRWLDARFGAIDPADNGAPQIEAALQLIAEQDIDSVDWEAAAKNAAPPISAADRANIERFQDALALLERGLDAPRCRLRVQWEDGIRVEIDHFLPLMQLANLLETRIAMHIVDGDEAAALHDADLLSRTPGVFAEDVTLLGWMVRLALHERTDHVLRFLAERGLDPARLQTIARLPQPGNAMRSIAGECAWALSAYHTVADGSIEDLGTGEPSLWHRFMQNTNLALPVLRSDTSHLLEHYLRMWEFRDVPAGQAYDDVRKIQSSLAPEHGGASIWSLFSSLLAPDFATSLEREDAVHQRLAATRSGLEQLAEWQRTPPTQPAAESFGQGESLWTVQSF